MDASPHRSSLSAPPPWPGALVGPQCAQLYLVALGVPLGGGPREGPALTCRWVMLRSMFMVDVSQFSEMYL